MNLKPTPIKLLSGPLKNLKGNKEALGFVEYLQSLLNETPSAYGLYAYTYKAHPDPDKFYMRIKAGQFAQFSTDKGGEAMVKALEKFPHITNEGDLFTIGRKKKTNRKKDVPNG